MMPVSAPVEITPQRWYQGLRPYQWWVFAVGATAWLFDCADQRIFMLARSPALSELLGRPQTDPRVIDFGTYATAATMAGWAVGGLAFGVLGDRWGRARTLAVSVLVYSIFTGLCGLATHSADFCLYRFLMGAGIGGAFATAATLIAETVPPHSRPALLGIFSALSLLGNMSGSVLARWLFVPEARYFHGLADGGVVGWRLLFFVGAAPALLVVLIIRTLREPEPWLQARREHAGGAARELGDLRGVFRHPRWRRHTWVAVAMATAGIVGVWGVGFWSPELISDALAGSLPTGGVQAEQSGVLIGRVKAVGSMLQDLGGFAGILTFTVCATRFGRRPTFAVAFVASFAIITYVFLTLGSATQAYVLLPILGFFTLSIMGGFVIYFPELFPTRLRSTGTALGYNLARLSAATVMLLGNPIREALHHAEVSSPFRVGAIALSTIYVLGLAALVWAPETKGRPLPED